MTVTKSEIRTKAVEIRNQFPRRWFSKASTNVAVAEIGRKAGNGDIDREYALACYGLEWARQTGRISSEAEMAIRALSASAIVILIVVLSRAKTLDQIPAMIERTVGR